MGTYVIGSLFLSNAASYRKYHKHIASLKKSYKMYLQVAGKRDIKSINFPWKVNQNCWRSNKEWTVSGREGKQKRKFWACNLSITQPDTINYFVVCGLCYRLFYVIDSIFLINATFHQIYHHPLLIEKSYNTY